ncbi:ankyrin repeat domain-containing protein [Marinicella sp. W31]|uniref:ankyrin repeat domain-containing protein n=1 Tax=Marinicella sp. W31 TaxID=3023713 RepID=UPI003756C64D
MKIVKIVLALLAVSFIAASFWIKEAEDEKGTQTVAQKTSQGGVREAMPADATLIKAILTNNQPLAEKLLHEGADPNAALGSQNETALIYAIGRFRSESLVQLLLEKGADPNIRDYSKNTPLIYAVQLSNESMVNALIKSGADVNAVAKRDETALLAAAEKGQVNIVKALIDSGADINHRNEIGYSALTIASYHGHQALSDYLKQQGAVSELFKQEVDAAVVKQIGRELSSLNATYQRCSQCKGQSNYCDRCQKITGLGELLDVNFLKQQAELTVGQSRLLGVISREGKDILGNPYVISPGRNGVHVSEDTFAALLKYQKTASIPLMQDLSKTHASPDSKKELQKAQQEAASVQRELGLLSVQMEQAREAGNQNEVEQLKPRFDALSERYQLSFMTLAKYAQRSGDSDVHVENKNALIMALLQEDLDRKIGESKRTPIQILAGGMNSVYLMKLLQIPFNLNALQNRVLSWTVSAQNTLTLRLLLAAGANPNLPGRDGEYPIHASVGYPFQMQLLLKYGADPEQKNKRGKTAYEKAIRLNDRFSQTLLLEAQESRTTEKAYKNMMARPAATGDINQIRNWKRTGFMRGSDAFYMAVKNNRIDVVQFFIDEGIKVRDVQVEYPLLRSAVTGDYLQMVQLLLQHEILVDEPNHLEKMTPLMLAVISNKVEMTKLFLASGADTTLKDRRGWTVVDLLPQANSPEMEALFRTEDTDIKKPKKKKSKLSNPMPTEPNGVSGGSVYGDAIEVIQEKIEPYQEVSPWDLIDYVNTDLIKVDGREMWQVTFSQSTPEGERLKPIVIRFSAQGEYLSHTH